MYPRTNYEMTEADLVELLEACKPVVAIMIGGNWPRSQQENANDAWAALGRKMGFDPMTVQPIQGKGTRFFTAIPSETDVQRNERLVREASEARKLEIAHLRKTIAGLQEKLDALRADSEG